MVFVVVFCCFFGGVGGGGGSGRGFVCLFNFFVIVFLGFFVCLIFLVEVLKH